MPIDGDKIKQLREKAGLSIAEAARVAGLKSRQHWYNIECGAGVNTSVATLEAIATALGVKAKDLLK